MNLELIDFIKNEIKNNNDNKELLLTLYEFLKDNEEFFRIYNNNCATEEELNKVKLLGIKMNQNRDAINNYLKTNSYLSNINNFQNKIYAYATIRLARKKELPCNLNNMIYAKESIDILNSFNESMDIDYKQTFISLYKKHELINSIYKSNGTYGLERYIAINKKFKDVFSLSDLYEEELLSEDDLLYLTSMDCHLNNLSLSKIAKKIMNFCLNRKDKDEFTRQNNKTILL